MKDIKVGVIVFILCFIFIQPILTFLGSILNKFISIFTTSYNDSIYIAAATRNTDSHISFIISSFFGILLGFIIIVIAINISVLFRSKRENATFESTNNEGVIKSLIKQRNKSISVFLVVYSVFWLLFEALTFYNKTVSVNLIYAFDQKIAILRPYISDDVLIKLSSDWGLMKSEKNYIEINNQLIELAKNNGITLPNK